MMNESRVKSQGAKRIVSFTDLVAWEKSHSFALQVYAVTGNFPSSETYGLTSQIRRAAVSVTSNIAEGFGRRTAADRLHFYDMARASLAEVQSQLFIARDVGYIDSASFLTLTDSSEVAHKLLTGLINATRGVRKS
jgi:four helix bundle protein